MKASLIAIAASALVGSVAAHERRHAHALFHEKEASTTEEPVCQTGVTTSWSTWYGEMTIVPPPPPPSTSSSTHSSTSCTSTHVAPSSTHAAPSSTHVAASSSVASSSPAESYSAAPSPKSVGSSGGKYAITYSPYEGTSVSETSCKSQGQVSSDIAAIASMGFGTVRIYATDCDHLPNVGGAVKANGMKMIIGIFIDHNGINSDTYSQLSDITAYFAGDYSIVDAALIGNEAVHNGFVSAGDMASFITHCKSTLRGAGYSGPVGSADTVAAFQANVGAYKGVVDIIGANMHPFFASGVEPSGAGAWLGTQFSALESLYGDIPIINSETGWPHAGPSFSGSVPNPSNQAAAIDSMSKSSYASKTVFFSNADDGWKADLAGTLDSVEPYWGCSGQFSG